MSMQRPVLVRARIVVGAAVSGCYWRRGWSRVCCGGLMVEIGELERERVSAERQSIGGTEKKKN